MDKKLLSLMSLFFLTFGIFVAVIVFNKPLTQLTRAKEEIAPSGTSSLIIAWPLKAPADGKTLATISVFVRSETNRPVINKQVSLTTSLGVIKQPSAVSDNEGKATFEITSTTAGTAQLQATIDTMLPVAQKVSIQFE